MANTFDEDATNFLNVDLDIFSKSRLNKLVAAFGDKIMVHYVGRDRSRYSAHFALGYYFPNTADTAIRAIARLVNDLPRSARKLWDGAQVKTFNIGIQAGIKPHFAEFPLHRDTLHTMAKLGARVIITVYAANRLSIDPDKSKSKSRAKKQRSPVNQRQ